MTLTMADIPELPGYVSVSRAAAIFGFSKPSIYYKIYEQGSFRHVYRIKGADDETRPVLVLLESEVLAVKEAEDAAAMPVGEADLPYAKRLTRWHRRVKKWGLDAATGSAVAQSINYRGFPTLQLQAAYLAAHPEDPKPVE
jgi:hypothetical protein